MCGECTECSPPPAVRQRIGGGAKALHLKNEHGVVMKLTSRSQGLQLNAAPASGIKVTMKQAKLLRREDGAACGRRRRLRAPTKGRAATAATTS